MWLGMRHSGVTRMVQIHCLSGRRGDGRDHTNKFDGKASEYATSREISVMNEKTRVEDTQRVDSGEIIVAELNLEEERARIQKANRGVGRVH
jgi:hypothetical protein